jgi:hypothetical protein
MRELESLYTRIPPHPANMLVLYVPINYKHIHIWMAYIYICIYIYAYGDRHILLEVSTIT